MIQSDYKQNENFCEFELLPWIKCVSCVSRCTTRIEMKYFCAIPPTTPTRLSILCCCELANTTISNVDDAEERHKTNAMQLERVLYFPWLVSLAQWSNSSKVGSGFNGYVYISIHRPQSYCPTSSFSKCKSKIASVLSAKISVFTSIILFFL